MLGKKLRYLASSNILVIYRLFSAVRYQQYYPSLMFQSNTNNNGSDSDKTSINAFYLSDEIQCSDDLLSLLRVNMPEMERQDSFKSVLRNVKRKLSTRERKQSKQDNDRNQLPSSLKCSPFSSNNNTPSRSPFLTPR